MAPSRARSTSTALLVIVVFYCNKVVNEAALVRRDGGAKLAEGRNGSEKRAKDKASQRRSSEQETEQR